MNNSGEGFDAVNPTAQGNWACRCKKNIVHLCEWTVDYSNVETSSNALIFAYEREKRLKMDSPHQEESPRRLYIYIYIYNQNAFFIAVHEKRQMMVLCVSGQTWEGVFSQEKMGRFPRYKESTKRIHKREKLFFYNKSEYKRKTSSRW